MSPAQLRALDIGVRLSRELLAEARAAMASDRAAEDFGAARNRRRRIRRLRAQLREALEATAAP